MKFGFHDIGIIEEGHAVEIVLDYATTVLVMDQTNYVAYKSNSSQYRAISKYVTFLPYIVRLPRTTRWFVVVESKGQVGEVNSIVYIHNKDKKINPQGLAKKLPELKSNAMAKKNEADAIQIEKLTKNAFDSTPLCCQLWNRYLDIIDCNEATVKLYGFKDRQEYIDRFFIECLPYYQIDGQISYAKMLMLVKNAFKEEVKPFRWMQQLPNGTSLLTEVTLVRASYQDDDVVAWYTKDISDIMIMESRIEALTIQANKIYYDPLTGIYNRRYLDENLEQIISTLSSQSKKLTVMMIDIDCFKLYNDSYGHAEGDNCLKIVAEVLQHSVKRPSDFISRYGGEEFTAVLLDIDENGACIIAERMLENIRSKNIPHRRNIAAKCVTFSVGIATSTAKHTQNGEDYINEADEMLYKAKKKGRNRYMHKNF